MSKPLILIGGGGHCKACIDVLDQTDFRIAGILDRSSDQQKIFDFPVLGGDELIKELVKDHQFLITIGQIMRADPRIKLYDAIKMFNGTLARVIAVSAIVSARARVGEGSIIMHHALVNAATVIGSNCIINNKALIEHDCIVGDHCHISTASVLNGGCRIGKRVFIGSGSVVSQGVQITDDVVIGAGSVVIRNIEEPGVYAGHPVRKIK
jgi:sugar O-acyltransferase (sialic acid O-acetyltransferase NeuD family)